MRIREVRDEVRGEVWFVDEWGRELTEETSTRQGSSARKSTSGPSGSGKRNKPRGPSGAPGKEGEMRRQVVKVKQTDEFVNPVTGEVISPSGLEQMLLNMLYGLSNVQKFYLVNELLKGLKRGRDLLRKKLLEELDHRPRREGELVAYVREREQMRFDAKAFEREHPELYREYLRRTVQKVVVVEKPDLVFEISRPELSSAEDMPL